MLPTASLPALEVDGMRGIALEEMARRRRRLGELTPEQERALRSLMVSVADAIHGLVSEAANGGRREGELNEAPKSPCGPGRAA